MNLVIYALYNTFHMPMLEAIAKHWSVDHCEVIGNQDSNRLKNIISRSARFHDWHAISEGYTDLNWQEILPLDQELIDSMRECEVEVYRMMDRKSGSILKAWSYEQRKKVYYEHLRFWNHVLSNTQFDAFLALNVPHEILDFVIFHLCKNKGVPTFFFYQFQHDFCFLMNDWTDPLPGLRAKIANNGYVDEKTKSKEFSERMRFEIEAQEDPAKSVVPFYMKKRKGGLAFWLRSVSSRIESASEHFWSFIGSVKELKIVEFLSRREEERAHKSHVKYLERFLEEHSLKPDLKLKYVYLPLHLQPELSTSPLAGRFVDQDLIVAMLSFYLPDDVYIFVKEHPNQRLEMRRPTFYQDLLKHSRVKLIKKDWSSKELLVHSEVVATASGTAGWEALFQRKPVFLFGNNFFQYAPGVFRIKSKDECKEAIRKVFFDQTSPDKKQFYSFLKALDTFVLNANIDIEYRQASQLSYEKDNLTLSSAICEKMSVSFHQVGPGQGSKIETN